MKLIKLLSIIFITMTIVSCNNDSLDTDGQEYPTLNDKVLDDFLRSEYFNNFLSIKQLTIADIDFTNLKKTTFEYKHVDSYVLPIEKNGKVVGKIDMFFLKANGEYRAIYNECSENETITISTLGGKYIATASISEKANGKKQARLIDVVDVDDFVESRGHEIERQPGESWWNCTARVYKIAKDSCGDADTCNLLCDLADIAAAQCTISVAAAAAIWCI